MKNVRSLVLSALLVAAGAYAQSAAAVLVSEISGLKVRGFVDPDSFNPNPALSVLEQIETTVPFTRSAVSVADSQAGIFDYHASSDIGALALRVFGSLTNTTASEIPSPFTGTPVLQVYAQAKDVVTLNSTLPGSFDVTLELVINGSITATGGAANASANAQLQFGLNPGLNSDDSALYPMGVISDTLSITKTVSGPSVDMDFNAFLSFNVLSLDPGATVTGELSNTALLRLIVPEGVTVADSGSGTFGVSIPVPEPHTYALMLGALGLVGFAARVRRRV